MEECEERYYIKNESVLEKQCFKKDALKIENGICIYEVIRVIDGVPLFLENHIIRMKNSVSLINKNIPMDDNILIRKILKLCTENHLKDGNVKIVIIYNESNTNCDVLLYFIKHYYPTKAEYENGVDTILFHGERNNPNAKIINAGFRNSVDIQIKERNVFEAVLVDNCGFITEGSKSNLFFVKGGTVYTPPVKKVLPGVTRKYVIDICEKSNINVIEGEITEDSLNTFDAVFISGTSPKILPVRKIEHYKYDSSHSTTVLKILQNYDKAIYTYLNEFISKYCK